MLRPIWIARGRIGLGHHSDRIVRVRPLGALPTDACGPDFGRAATCHQRRLRAAATFPGWRAQAAPPAWVEWLKGQPSQVRLAAFAMPEPEALSIDWWGGRAISWLPLHRHATLNGSDYALLEGDLRLLGGSYERINPAGLRFVASLGYDTLAFHRDYLKTNSWIEALPWLDRVDERDVWEIFRINKGFLRFPQTTLEQILARGNLEEEPATKIPPDCWITGSWPVAEDTYVADSNGALLTWTDESGRTVSQPKRAFYQHVFGPSIPAYTVRSPKRRVRIGLSCSIATTVLRWRSSTRSSRT